MFETKWMSLEDKADNWFTHTGSWLHWLRRAFQNEELADRIFGQTLHWNGTTPSYSIAMGRVACLVKDIELAHAFGSRFVGVEESKERGPYLTYLQPHDQLPDLWLDLQGDAQ
jgi:hypothetical protein